jgi:hypothetical protein
MKGRVDFIGFYSADKKVMHFKSFCKTDVCLDLISAYSLFDAD